MLDQQILVTGASGFIGRHLVGYLAGRGCRVRAMWRSVPAAAPVEGVTPVLADLCRPESLDGAVAGCGAIVHLAGAADSSDPAVNQAVNVDGTRNLLAACERQAVRPRVVFFSSHCAERALQDAYGQTKREAEQLLADWPHVILRPTMIYGEGSKEFTTFVRTIRRLPVVPIIGDGTARIRPSFLDDVLPAVLEALRREQALGRRVVICGPQPISFDELVQQVAQRMLGRSRRILHVPGALALLGARLLGRLWRHPPITVDQVMGFLQDSVADPQPARELLGFEPRPVDLGLETLFARCPAAMW